MLSDALTKMLILQDRDMKLQQIEDALRVVPEERKGAQARIDEANARLEATRLRIKELETRAKSIEGEMAAVEAQIVKYKNQQLQVKKNEEYQALTHEIAAAGEKISQLESKELETLYELDEARRLQAEEAARCADQLQQERRTLERLDEKEELHRGQLDDARVAQAAAEAQLDNPSRSKYRQVARGIRFPVVVEATDHKCSGCHMRVSNAIESEVRAGREITTCDNCGRILYSAS